MVVSKRSAYEWVQWIKIMGETSAAQREQKIKEMKDLKSEEDANIIMCLLHHGLKRTREEFPHWPPAKKYRRGPNRHNIYTEADDAAPGADAAPEANDAAPGADDAAPGADVAEPGADVARQAGHIEHL